MEKPEYFRLATALENNPAVAHFSRLAGELEVVLPISFFEKNGSALTFYGSSFITDHRGCVVAQCDRQSPGVIVAELDPRAYKSERAAWGLFRDRRPDMYGPIMTLDGEGRP
jgi:predicted amidohydrolase